jgi:tungstate transport system permease protein
MSFTEALIAALHLLATLDADVFNAASVSLQVSIAATIIAAVLGVPAGYCVGAREFPGRRGVELGLRTLTALPTVVVGLFVYTLLSRRGLLGPLGLLYTKPAMIIGATVLVAPLMAALTMGVVAGADPRLEETALTLGASRFRAGLTVLAELRRGLLAAVATVFGRLISELGVALMVGGNIHAMTRTMTTAIALETSKGEFALGFALGIILLMLALSVNVAVAALTPRS